MIIDMRIWLFFICVWFFTIANMMAQTDPTTTGYINIITPITLNKTADMNFGVLNVGTGGGSCVLSSTGTRTYSGDITLSGVLSEAEAGAFTVTGNPGYTYVISLPSSFDIFHTDGVNKMIVNNLKARVEGSGSDGLTGVLAPGLGTQSFTVGATLNVDAGQEVGVYEGYFTVSVDYN